MGLLIGILGSHMIRIFAKFWVLGRLQDFLGSLGSDACCGVDAAQFLFAVGLLVEFMVFTHIPHIAFVGCCFAVEFFMGLVLT